MDSMIRNILLMVGACLVLPAVGQAGDVVTSKHHLKNGERLDLVLRQCENGRHPIPIAHAANPAEKTPITLVENIMADRSSYFIAKVDKEIDAIIAQVCDPREIRSYFLGLKKAAADKE